MLLANNGAGKVQRPREELVFHFPHYQSVGGPQSAIISGSLKLLKYYEDGRVALYDLSEDLGEKKNLSKDKPELAALLEDKLDAYLRDVQAHMPKPNPDYGSSKLPR